MNEGSWHPAAMAGNAVRLYRPVGPAELNLVKESGWKAFPPRLPIQPFFYPITNRKYAQQIAEDCNKPRDGVGYVLLFYLRVSFLLQFEEKVVGNRTHREFWIPADRMKEVNANIVGPIEVLVEYR